MADDFKVYWQPGCSSCLRAKEFLARRGIAYESINVRARPEAMEELAGLGAQSVPVVAQGKRFVFAQDLGDLARFIGVEFDRAQLPPAELVRKLDLILAACNAISASSPPPTWKRGCRAGSAPSSTSATTSSSSPRPSSTPPTAPGSPSTISSARPGPDMRSAAQVAAYGEGVRDALASWWRAADGGRLGTLDTYYGIHPTERVLERTAWHAAQHARQLMALLEQRGIAPDGALGEDALDGLPLPEGVYDDEVALEGGAAG